MKKQNRNFCTTPTGHPCRKVFAENIGELIGLIKKDHFYIEPSQGEWATALAAISPGSAERAHAHAQTSGDDALRLPVSKSLDRSAPKGRTQRTDYNT